MHKKVNVSSKPIEYHISIDEFNKCCFFMLVKLKILDGIFYWKFMVFFFVVCCYSINFPSTFDRYPKTFFKKEIFLNLKVVGLLVCWYSVFKIQCNQLACPAAGQPTNQTYITSINLCASENFHFIITLFKYKKCVTFNFHVEVVLCSHLDHRRCRRRFES